VVSKPYLRKKDAFMHGPGDGDGFASSRLPAEGGPHVAVVVGPLHVPRDWPEESTLVGKPFGAGSSDNTSAVSCPKSTDLSRRGRGDADGLAPLPLGDAVIRLSASNLGFARAIVAMKLLMSAYRLRSS